MRPQRKFRASLLSGSRRGGSHDRNVAECIPENFELGTTPSVRAEVAIASFLDRTATPPNLGGDTPACNIPAFRK